MRPRISIRGCVRPLAGLNDLYSIHYTNDVNRYQQDLQAMQTDANLCLFTANLCDTILTFLLSELSSEA